MYLNFYGICNVIKLNLLLYDSLLILSLYKLWFNAFNYAQPLEFILV